MCLRKMNQNQALMCKKHKVEPIYSDAHEKLGIALDSIGKYPINALRHNAENGTCGWYIWCGEELNEDANFFKPLHVDHVSKYLPEIEPFLALPPGYRVLLAPGYEDVWYDSSLVVT